MHTSVLCRFVSSNPGMYTLLVRSGLQSFFSIYASGPHLSSLPQSLSWPDPAPNLGAARPGRAHRRRFDTLVILVARSLWKQRNAMVFANVSQQFGTDQIISRIKEEISLWMFAKFGGSYANDGRVGLALVCECVCFLVLPIRVARNKVFGLVICCSPSIKIWYTFGVLSKKRARSPSPWLSSSPPALGRCCRARTWLSSSAPPPTRGHRVHIFPISSTHALPRAHPEPAPRLSHPAPSLPADLACAASSPMPSPRDRPGRFGPWPIVGQRHYLGKRK
jgi:hypothetical protein